MMVTTRSGHKVMIFTSSVLRRGMLMLTLVGENALFLWILVTSSGGGDGQKMPSGQRGGVYGIYTEW